ncbi:hypothetical protein G8V07_11555 [Clostridium botulinum D/C]|uniref:hypothetical protein n=1 Tax=Clostridium botulinum TaxID=1491 RepID=UPI001E3AA4D9|nr:hypothetical protein [Clostridium botulinum]MCD3319519.1 hypothetical protein [Clostridium botulinum D/C]MCD3324384.1 hypothetical protein [Clostridium botulinum D/C]MCD3327824.1 hypothetical protein [Clostridium botulinum D/C]
MLKSNLIKLIKKTVGSADGKVLLSILLLVCVLATKGLYDNNMQIVQAITQKHLIKSNISTCNYNYR